MPGYVPTIGLEVHAQLATKTKIFCGCATSFAARPNTNVCPVCLGLPGALPVLNALAVELATILALAVGCTVRERSVFSRKSYFYPDLPKGYQITQYDEPLAEHGHLEAVRIRRIHMEEDAGKTTHTAQGHTIVDLNRAGTPLIEIVSEPDLESAGGAADYLRALREILLFTGTSDGNLEEGSFRCDANVSIRPEGSATLGTRVELKNINSFRFVQKAIESEIERQRALALGGEKIVQETRGWDEERGVTFSMRSKEEAQDYRYFPEPDLGPLVLGADAIARARGRVPELPKAKRERFVRDFGIAELAAQTLTQHPSFASLFEETVRRVPDAQRVAGFIQSEVLRDAKTDGLRADLPIDAERLADLLNLVSSSRISGKQAKEVYARVARTAAIPSDVVRELGMEQVSDASAIQAIVDRLVLANPKQADQIRAGKVSVRGFFVGLVMKETKGSANPQLVNVALDRALARKPE